MDNDNIQIHKTLVAILAELKKLNKALVAQKKSPEEQAKPEPAKALAQLIFEKTGEKLTPAQAKKIMAASIQRLKANPRR